MQCSCWIVAAACKCSPPPTHTHTSANLSVSHVTPHDELTLDPWGRRRKSSCLESCTCIEAVVWKEWWRHQKDAHEFLESCFGLLSLVGVCVYVYRRISQACWKATLFSLITYVSQNIIFQSVWVKIFFCKLSDSLVVSEFCLWIVATSHQLYWVFGHQDVIFNNGIHRVTWSEFHH